MKSPKRTDRAAGWDSLTSGDLTRSASQVTPEQTEAVRRIGTWLRLEQQRQKTFDPSGRLEEIEEPGGGRFKYVYDRPGNLTQIIEDDGSSTTYQYDDRRRLIGVNHPDGGVTRYTYGDNDRLAQINHLGTVSSFEHDALGRLTRIHRGKAGAAVFKYEGQGRVIEGRTSVVSTRQELDASGRVVAIRQMLNGVALNARLTYDDAGRLAEMFLPGSTCPVGYEWDARGRLSAVTIGNRRFADIEYVDQEKIARIRFASGVTEETRSDLVDSRPVWRRVATRTQVLFQREYQYSPEGNVIEDGAQRYEYDQLGRLNRVQDLENGSHCRFSYDNLDNRDLVEGDAGPCRFRYDGDGRLVQIEQPDRSQTQVSYDLFGRPIGKISDTSQWIYRYDDAGQLVQALYRGGGAEVVAEFTYDHKSRLVMNRSPEGTRRYLYGPSDELLAVTDEKGTPLRLYPPTPLGALAEVRGPVHSGDIYSLHYDDGGTCHLVTDEQGGVVARFQYCPFGAPTPLTCPGQGPVLSTAEGKEFLPIFRGRLWNPELGMYHFGARWYDPHWGRFLTPDSYTGSPDDPRLIHPFGPASKQALYRSQILGDWLKQPRLRNRYAFCANDPVNRFDPNGHWSFGGILLSILGAIWTLPNTLIGLFIAITWLIGEVIRWLVSVFGGNVWEPIGLDAAASGRLNAFALVFEGGWIGSFSSLLGITFGNVFFVYKNWPTHPAVLALPATVSPPAYGGKVSFASSQALYEHELRHTNQYGWFGPFFHLGPPFGITGVYLWDWALSGFNYSNMWLERDAREHGGF